MKNTVNMALIEMFNAVVVNGASRMVDANKVNELAFKLGFVVMPEACTEDVYVYLKSKDLNYNSTFYKNWEDVTSKTRFELLIDQLIHYMTTYGTCFEFGNGYVPNDGLDLREFKFDNYKVISAITPKEMFEKCMGMLTAGIALKQATMDALVDYVIDFAMDNQCDVDVDSVKNREARIKMYEALGLMPRDRFELIKYMLYKATGKTTVIKNRAFLAQVRAGATNVDMSKLTEAQEDALASIFYRYKDLILMMKAYHRNAPVINRIRRKAVKLHKPMKVGFWESLFNEPHTTQEIFDKSAELTNYKILALMQAIRERVDIADKGDAKVMYIIRNGKMYVKDAHVSDVKNLSEVYNGLAMRLLDNLQKKACKVKLPANLHIACPVSEKNFVGNLPFGSYFDMSKNNIIGIYWRNEWGTHDFDLSMNDVNGGRIGWDASYYDAAYGREQNIIYSGDMTNAAPEATELLYAKNTCPNGSVYINRYNGMAGSKYKFFFANECLDNKVMKNYMVDPNNIKVDVMCESGESSQQMIGVVCDQKFFFMNFGNGNTRVAYNHGYTQEDIFKIYARKSASVVYLDELLPAAGFTVVTPEEEAEGVEFLDLTNLDKDTLIKLFDKNAE